MVKSLVCGALVGLCCAPAWGWEANRDLSTGDFRGCAKHPTRRAGDQAQWDAYATVFTTARELQPEEQVLVVARLRTRNLHVTRQATLVKSYIAVEGPGGLSKGSARAGQNNTGKLYLQNAIVFRNPKPRAATFKFKLMMLVSNQPNTAHAKPSYPACTPVTGEQRGVEILGRSVLKIRPHAAPTVSRRGDPSFQLHRDDQAPRNALEGADEVTVGASGMVRFKTYAQVTFCYTDRKAKRCGPGWDSAAARVRVRLMARTRAPGAAGFGAPVVVGKRSAVISRPTHHKMIYMNRKLRLTPGTVVNAWLEFKNVGAAPIDVDLMGGGSGAAAKAQLLFFSH